MDPTPTRLAEDAAELLAAADPSATSLLTLALYYCEELYALFGDDYYASLKRHVRPCFRVMEKIQCLTENRSPQPEADLRDAIAIVRRLVAELGRDEAPRSTPVGPGHPTPQAASPTGARSPVDHFLLGSQEALSGMDHLLMSAERKGASEQMLEHGWAVFRAIRDGARQRHLSELESLAGTGANLLRLLCLGVTRLEGALLDHLFEVTHLIRSLLDSKRRADELREMVGGRSRPPGK